MEMTERKLWEYIFKKDLQDRWMVLENNGKPGKKRYRLEDLLDKAKKEQLKRIMIVNRHRYMTGEYEVIMLDTTSRMRAPDREHLKRSLSKQSLGLQIQLLSMVGILGVVNLMYHWETLFPPQGEKELVEILEEQMEEDDFVATGETLPELDLVVAYTRSQMLLTNTGQETWPECKITLITDDGDFDFHYELRVKPANTKLISLWRFQNGERDFKAGSDKPKRVRVEVPEYTPFEKAF